MNRNRVFSWGQICLLTENQEDSRESFNIPPKAKGNKIGQFGGI